jgi:hypothetical protein
VAFRSPVLSYLGLWSFWDLLESILSLYWKSGLFIGIDIGLGLEGYGGILD